ncbi:serine/threonine protein kinase [Apiospora marii]|uniref:serine/threonine protein kinase n=1 Tax=Apiospora marii TaxID=335849 RepID=UPI00312E2F2A
MAPGSSEQQTESYELQNISQFPSLSPPGVYPSDAPQIIPDDPNAATSATQPERLDTVGPPTPVADLAKSQAPTSWKSRLSHVWEDLTVAKICNVLFMVVALLGFPLTAIAIWPSFLAASDGHKAEQIAEWTAKKDFIEACEARDWSTVACENAKGMQLEAPPIFDRSDWKRYSKRHHEKTHSWPNTPFTETRGRIEIYYLTCWITISAFLFVYQGTKLMKAYTRVRVRGKADNYTSTLNQPVVPPTEYTDEYWNQDLETNFKFGASGIHDDQSSHSALSVDLSRLQTAAIGPVATRRNPWTFHESQTTSGGSVPVMTTDEAIESIKEAKETRTPRESLNRPPALPVVTTDDGIEWMKEAKKTRTPRELPGWSVTKDILAGRNFIIIVDDSVYMQQHRDEVFRVAKVLSYLVKQMSPHGFEVIFTSNPMQKSTCQTSSKVESHLRNHFDQEPNAKCQMEFTLENVLEDVKSKLLPVPLLSKGRLGRLTRQESFSVSIYILTSGVWDRFEEGTCGVENPIESLIAHMMAHEIGRTEASIQFVRFGADERGIKRLTFLDDDLPQKEASRNL